MLLKACPHCRRKVRQSPNFAVFGDSRTFLRQCGQGLTSLQQVGNFPVYGKAAGKRVKWILGIKPAPFPDKQLTLSMQLNTIIAYDNKTAIFGLLLNTVSMAVPDSMTQQSLKLVYAERKSSLRKTTEAFVKSDMKPSCC